MGRIRNYQGSINHSVQIPNYSQSKLNFYVKMLKYRENGKSLKDKLSVVSKVL